MKHPLLENIMSRQFINLSAPPDSTVDSKVANAVVGGNMGKEDVIEFLSDDSGDDKPDIIPLDDKTKEKDTKDTKKTKETEEESELEVDEDDDDIPDELSELEEELEEPDDEKLELVTPVRRAEILKLYPKLFKDFPYLEKAYYREQQYTQLLPTIDDAKQAVEAVKTLDEFESDLSQGKLERVLMAAKEAGQKGFAKIADEYMANLAKVDEKAYHHVLGNTIKHTIMAMAAESKKSGNEALMSAAHILNQFIFGSSDFVPPTNLAVEDKKSEAEDEVTKERKALMEERFNTAREDLYTKVNNSIKATIEANIDPKGTMSDYVRKNASREAQETLETMINGDKRFKIIVDKLWDKAFESKFSKDSVDKLRSAFMTQAKTLLPTVIKKARNEALRGMGKRVVESDDDKDNKVPVRERKQTTSRSNNSSDAKIKPGMSSLEFLMSED